MCSKLEQAQFLEIGLPISRGGLGLPDLVAEAPNAYFSSVLAVLQRWRDFLPDGSNFLQRWVAPSQPPSYLQEAHATVAKIVKDTDEHAGQTQIIIPDSVVDLMNFAAVDKLQQRLNKRLHDKMETRLRTTVLTSVKARAQYLSKTTAMAAACLSAVPSDRALSLANSDFTWFLRSHFRLPYMAWLGVNNDLKCYCRRQDKYGNMPVCSEDHVLKCSGDNLWLMRHNAIVSASQDMLQSTQLSPKLEQIVAPGSDLRFDLTVEGLDSMGTQYCLDISVRHPHNSRIEKQTARLQLHAANEGVKEKQTKYSKFIKGNTKFLPIVLETFGAVHPNVRELVALAAKRVNNIPYDSATFAAPTFAVYWLQRLSVTLQRENAKLAYLIALRSKEHHGDGAVEDITNLESFAMDTQVLQEEEQQDETQLNQQVHTWA